MTEETSTRRLPDAPADGGGAEVANDTAGPSRRGGPDTERRKLEIEVAWGDITSAEDGVCAVGHYMGVLPQRAELAVDWAVSGTKDERRLLLTELTKRGALRGELGEIAFFPMTGGGLAAVAGMGRPGMFNRSRLEFLMRALVGCVGLLPKHNTLATVLIGSGEGSRLKTRDCVEAMLEMVVEAVSSDARLSLTRFRIVELHLDRALEVLGHVGRVVDGILRDRRAGDLDLALQTQLQRATGGRIDTRFGYSMVLAALAEFAGSEDVSKAPLLEQVLTALPDDDNLKSKVLSALQDAGRARTETQAAERLRGLAMAFRIQQESGAQGKEVLSRLGFWAEQDDIRATAITDTVTVTQRDFRKRLRLVQAAVERLQDPDPGLQPEYAAKLYRALVHPDLSELVQGRTESLVLEVDSDLAPVQWEMLPGPEGKPLGTSRPVARQLRTFYSPRPAEIGARERLRALVIGDPGDPASSLSLPDAQQEAEVVWEILTESDRIDHERSRLLIGAPADGTLAGPFFEKGIAPADYFEVVQLLLSGEFDIVHYCGHAQFDPENPSEAGWVFKADVLTGADLDGMVRAPLLVMANACLSGRLGLTPGSIEAARRSDPRLVAALANEFFHCGVADYIGTAWEVPSKPAKTFAKRFYEGLLAGKSIGEAVQLARKTLYESDDARCTWGAYQHYGDPTRTLFGRR